MEYLIEQYRKAHPNEDQESVTPHLVADWAVERGLWIRPPITLQERLRRELSRHLRGEYTKDPQGRAVRLHHAIIYMEQSGDGPKRRSKWYRIYEAPAKHMQASLALRRRSAFADVQQLQLDLESYNENNVLGEQVPAFDYNFNVDLEEARMPTHYPEEGPADDPATDEDGESI
jgi:hypothetical protein